MFDPVALTEQSRKAADADASLCSDEELLDAVLGLEEARRLIDAAEGHALAQLEARGVCDAGFGSSTRSWLAREAKLPSVVARNRVKTGVALSGPLRAVDEALVDGRIGFDHARVLADAASGRVAEEVTAIQETLIELAEGAVFEWWRRDVLGLVDLLDQDGGHDRDNDLARNKLTVARTFDGITHVAGTLTGEHGEIARQAIEAKANELFHRFSADRKHCPELSIPDQATLRALAFVELCRLGQAADLNTTKAPRPDVTLAVNALDPTSATTPDGVRLADANTRTLLCDPDLTPIVIDSLGVPLDLGRTVRYATPAQRRAIALRDGGCTFPGCLAPPSWCDAHHLEEFHAELGATDIDNLVCLCRHHHGVTHRKGWHMDITDDGWFHWTTPSGHTFWSQRHGRQRAGPAPPPARE
jgi:hypothetical protein